MSKFWSPFVKDLVPYVPGEQPKLSRLVKLNTNENPYGPSPQALAAMQAELNDDLRLYPDPNGERLKQAVAAHYGVQANQVFVGNGSDEVLAHIFHGLFQHDLPLLFPDVTYSFYPVYCGLYGIAHEKIALDERFRIRVEDYARPNGGIIFPNPNAPTGCLLPLDAIEAMLKASPDSVVVVDEAYVDFWWRERHRPGRSLPEPAGHPDAVQVALPGRPAGRPGGRPCRSGRGAGADQEQFQFLPAGSPGDRRRGGGFRGRRLFPSDLPGSDR